MRIYLSILLSIFVQTYTVLCQTDTLPEVEIEEKKISKPSQTYKIITLKNTNENNLKDVLSENSAIYIKSYGINNLSTISIRGANASQTQVVWNGFSINSPTLGQNDLSIISTSLINNIDINLGNSSLVNSSGGLGGAIHLYNEPTFKEQTNIIATKDIGSFGINNTTIKLELGNKKWQYFAGLTHKKAKNNFLYKDVLSKEKKLIRQLNSNYKQIETSHNLYYKISNKNKLSLKTNFSNSIRLLPPIIGVKSRGESQLDNNIKTSLEWNFDNEKYFHKTAIGYFSDYMNYIDTINSINSEVKVNSYKNYYKGKYYFNNNSQFRFSYNLDLFFATSSGFNKKKNMYKNSIYLEYYNLLKNKLSYTLSIRKDFISLKTPFIIPAISLKWNKNKSHNFLFSTARNFRQPTLNDLYWNPGGNINLMPEQGITSDLGYKYSKKHLDIGITLYYSFIKNWIQWLPSHKGYWSPINIREVETYGLEIETKKKYKYNKLLISIIGGYNLTFSLNKKSGIANDLSIGNQLIYVPKNTANGVLKINYKKLEIVYKQSYNGSVFIDASNNIYMPYYAPATIRVGYDINKKESKTNLKIMANVINLYNEDYQIVANRPMPLRYFMFTIKIGFNK